MFVRCGGIFFPWIADVFRCGFFWDHECLTGVEYFFFLRSRMFVRCGVFFWDRGCLLGVGFFFWDHECLLGVGFFLRSRMFDRCGVFFWDRRCLLGVGYILRSWMFDRWGVFFFFFERCGVSRWYSRGMIAGCGLGLPTKKKKVRSRIFLVHRLDRARTSELELKIDRLFLKDKRTSWLWKWMTTFGYSSIMSSKWNVNYKTRLICKASQLKTRKRNACTKA